MAFDRDAAKAAGYTDDEINGFLQAEAAKEKAPTPITSDVGEPPAPVTQISNVETSAGSMATQAGMAAAPYVIPAALGAGGLYGANVLKQGFNALQANNATRQAAVDAQQAATQGLQQRFDQRAAQAAGQAVKPVVPTGPAPMAPVAPTMAPPMQTAAAAAEQPGVMNRAADIVKRLALDKVLPSAGKIAGAVGRVAGPASLAMQTTDLGPQTPQVGRMKGMEINPLSGRPWTPNEIAAYEKNSAMYDQQLAKPQLPR